MNNFKEATTNSDEYTDTVSSYIDWCTSVCIPSWTILVPCRYTHEDQEPVCSFQVRGTVGYKHARYGLQNSIRVHSH